MSRPTRWQGATDWEGDCPAERGGYFCTLDAGHAGAHEAWGASGSDPKRAWGDVSGQPGELVRQP